MLHPPSKLLFRCLLTTDLCVGIFAEPLAVTYWMSVVPSDGIFVVTRKHLIFVAGHVLCSMSLLTLTAISVDRLLALLLGLRYRQLVTLKQTYASITVLWVVSIVGATMHFWNLFWVYKCATVCSHLNFLLRKHFSHSPSSS